MKKYIIISGKVQGVGFRYWLQNLASKKKVCGWVKNTKSGNVEALFTGKEKDVKELIKLCETGPSSAVIDSLQINDYNENYVRKNFDILPSD